MSADDVWANLAEVGGTAGDRAASCSCCCEPRLTAPPPPRAHSRCVDLQHGARQQRQRLPLVAVQEELALSAVGCVHVCCGADGHEVQPRTRALHKLQARQVAVQVPARQTAQPMQDTSGQGGSGHPAAAGKAALTSTTARCSLVASERWAVPHRLPTPGPPGAATSMTQPRRCAPADAAAVPYHSPVDSVHQV